MSRPEHAAPPEVFYNDDEAQKYTSNTRIIEIQNRLAERALELLSLSDEHPSMLLDIGCGSGLSGEVLSDNGHVWVGVDISRHMLKVGVEREVSGDTVESDIGQGLPFRFSCLARGSKAVLQFYPENAQQMEMITTAAMRCGFTGGLLVDFPHSAKAKKYYLVLFAGASANFTMPKALGTDEEVQNQIAYGSDERIQQQGNRNRKGKRPAVKSKDWVKDKKDRQRRQGREVRPDSKYTGRKRGPKF